MLNKLVALSGLSKELKAQLVESYPDGISEEDITTVNNAKGESIDCVELITPEVKYLIKLEVRSKIMDDLNDGEIDSIALEDLEDF